MGVGIVTSKTRLLQNRRPAWPFCRDEDSPQSRNLVGWWPLGPGLLGNAKDLSANSIDLANNGPTSVMDSEMGVVGKFVRASSQYLRGTGAKVDNVPNTLCAWAKATSLPGLEKIFHIGDGYLGWYLQFNSAGSQIRANERSGSGERTLYGPTSITLDQWYLIVAVFEALDNRHLYIDGKWYADSTVSGTLPSPINYTTIGRHSDVNTDYLDGHVADARVYNTALSADDIAALYDPASRWDLYYPLGRTRYVVLGGGGGATFDRTLSTGSAASVGQDITAQRLIQAGQAAANGQDASLQYLIDTGVAVAAGQDVGNRFEIGTASAGAAGQDVTVERLLSIGAAAGAGQDVDGQLQSFSRTLETASAAAVGLAVGATGPAGDTKENYFLLPKRFPEVGLGDMAILRDFPRRTDHGYGG